MWCSEVGSSFVSGFLISLRDCKMICVKGQSHDRPRKEPDHDTKNSAN
jgi:hypothetical protein